VVEMTVLGSNRHRAREMLIEELWAWAEVAVGWVPGRIGSRVRAGLYRPIVPGLRHVGEGVKIRRPWLLTSEGGLALSRGCDITCSGGVTFGRNVTLGPDVLIVSNDHRFEVLGTPIRQQGLRSRPVKIEDDVWIGARAIILAGSRVGRGAVVAAGAVVRGDVANNAIVGGVPAKILGWRGGTPPANPAC